MEDSIAGVAREARQGLDEKPVRAERWSRILLIASVATLVAATGLTLASALVLARWLAWVKVGLMALGLGLAFASWKIHQAADLSVARATGQTSRALAAQSRRLDAFREIAAAGGQSLDLREVLELGLEKVLQVTDQEAAEIHLLDPDNRTMATKASFGGPEGFLMRKEVIMLGECLCGLAVLNDEPVLVPDTQQDSRVTRLSCRRFGFRSAACVPLRVKGEAIGVLTVHGRDPHHFDAEDAELLIAVANQLSTAIENARLYAHMEARVEVLSRELQHLAVVEERERLSREMHDGLAQTLSLLSIQVGQMRSLLSAGDVAGGLEELQEMGRVIDAGYEEVREAITNLRLTAPKGTRFVEWLKQYVHEFGLRHDLTTELHVPLVRSPDRDGAAKQTDQPLEAPLVLPPHQEVHLSRIIQEALNNIRKHAQANHVQMALIPNGHKLTLRIHDDGLGFKVDRAQGRRGRYGLSTMRERAELLGGHLHIQSVPGQGTTITVEIEREKAAKEKLDRKEKE